jgi:hypothetical protein
MTSRYFTGFFCAENGIRSGLALGQVHGLNAALYALYDTGIRYSPLFFKKTAGCRHEVWTFSDTPWGIFEHQNGLFGQLHRMLCGLRSADQSVSGIPGNCFVSLKAAHSAS